LFRGETNEGGSPVAWLDANRWTAAGGKRSHQDGPRLARAVLFFN